VHRRRPKLKPPPVTSPPRIRTKLTSRITRSSSSRFSAHRRPLHRLREAAEHRRRPIPVPHLTAGDQTLALARWALSLVILTVRSWSCNPERTT
jgi:hypothetical protein